MYPIRSADYLSRAKAQRSSESPAQLFYAALELRFGIEARALEYRNALEDRRKNTDWMVGKLIKEVGSIYHTYTKPVDLLFKNEDSGEHFTCRYIPMSKRLEKIGGMLGEFLHSYRHAESENEEFWTKLRNLLDEGIASLSECASGELLAPPIWKGTPTKRVVLKFDTLNFPTPRQVGASFTIRVRFQVVSKANHHINLIAAQQ
jgi:hypothetical protein